MTKPVLVVTTRYPTEVEDRIDRDYSARRNPNRFPFSEEELLSAAEGADALFITPADQLDSGFFQKVSPTVKIIATYSVGFEHVDLQIHYYDPSEFPAEIAGDAVYHKDPSDLLRASQFLSHKPSAPRGHRGEHRSRRIGGRRRPHRCSQERAGRRCRARCI
jgi:phosphoglycerate dehydrogenase-like enzyme